MRIQVLGCSGGIGGGARTTALRVDDDILIDAGTGVADLSLAELAAIDHVFLTHAHLDHVACLPLLADSAGPRRNRPVVVHAQEATLRVLRDHLFNDALWPDFTRIPSPAQPYLRFEALAPGDRATLAGRVIRSIPVTHSIPAVGYLLDGEHGSLAFSGDTTTTEVFWDALNNCERLRHLIVELSFTDEDEALSRLSGHLCPRLLATELGKLTRPVEIHVTHLAPGEEGVILAEAQRRVPGRTLRALHAGAVFEI